LRFSVEIVIAAFARRTFEPYGLIGGSVVGEFGGQYVAGFQEFAVLPVSFVNDIETVAASQIGVEVDVGGKHFDELAGDRIRNACCIGCRK